MAWTSPAVALAETPTPTIQARAMHAEFLATAPPPDNPGVTCLVDTGVDLNPDTESILVGRRTVVGGGVCWQPVSMPPTISAAAVNHIFKEFIPVSFP
jgi:hypothetical protein